MKLYIKEKRFSLRDQLLVQDEQKEVLYTVKSERIAIGNKVHIYNQSKEKVLSIEEKKIGFSPKYMIYQQDEKVGAVKKETNLIASDYVIEKIDWKIKGNVEKEDYEIKKGFSKIASFKKKRFSYGDSYVLDIEEKKDAQMVLAIIIAVWCLQLDEKNDG